MIHAFSFALASSLPQPLAALDMPRPRISRSIGLALAVLLHVLGIWMLIARDPLVIQPPSAGSDNPITFVAPLADAGAPQPITPPVVTPKPPKPKSIPLRKPPPTAQPKPPVLARAVPPRPITLPRPAVATTTPVTPAEPLTPAPNIASTADAAPVAAASVSPASAPTEDFSARIDAARKRRAEARAQDPALAEATETEAQRANRIVRDNIAFSQRGQGSTREQTGGIFDLRNVTLHRAEFTFRGWNPNFKRNWLQLVEVEQGAEVDIEQAVVTKMIGVIRANRQGEFIFESRRLGRQVTQNAEPAFEPALRTFLLKEFFPNYVRGGAGSAR